MEVRKTDRMAYLTSILRNVIYLLNSWLVIYLCNVFAKKIPHFSLFLRPVYPIWRIMPFCFNITSLYFLDEIVLLISYSFMCVDGLG